MPEKRSEGAARRPLLIVVSAPSGAGKTTLCERLLRERPDIAYSVSCTTRAPRGHEVDGEDYHFLTEAEFADRAARGEFLEQATVHDHRYGTLRHPVADSLSAGRSVLMDIDVQGAAAIRSQLDALAPDDILRRSFVDIFVAPPSLAVLRQRLEGRGEDTPAVIERRLRNAGVEMARAHEYRYRIVNDDLERAYGELRTIVEREGRLT